MGEAKRKKFEEEKKVLEKMLFKQKLKRIPKALLLVISFPLWLPICMFIAVINDGKWPWED